MAIQFYGIRHHGPGSARSLLQALQEQQPDCVLIEHPADTEAALLQASTPGLEPPVAMLVYDPKVFSRAAYYPFARFSPEWAALQYAATLGIPVKPMDLPAGIQLAAGAQGDAMIPELTAPADPEQLEWTLDPLGQLASLAGYADSERWWEAVLELNAAGSAVFEVIAEMIAALRSHNPREETPETLLREAHMRQAIREAVHQGHQRITVVCGAWHVPALQSWQSIKASHDKALLKGRKGIKVQAVWIPWTYERLALDSGYRAGVLSPAWYELLFDHPAESTQRWMVRAARLMREEDMEVSPAHAMEGVRLASALAALRGHAIPGIEDMEEAALSIFFQGNRDTFALIRRRLVVGEKTGTVPAALPAAPLLRDLEQEVRSARLSKEYASVEEVQKDLDLRTDTQRQASRLLHRLNLLGVPWGTLMEKQGPSISTFRESWRLKWLPDYALQLVKAGSWGNTVETAALQCVLDRSRRSGELPELAALAAEALRADLQQAVTALVEKLDDAAALARDVHLLMDTLPGLVRIARYGNVRRTDAETVQRLIRHFVPRIAIGFPAACLQLDDEPADSLFKKMWETQRNVLLLGEDALSAAWLQALAQVAGTPDTHPLLQGGAVRILFDREVYTETETGNRFALALSAGNEPLFSARWVEGFLYGSGLLLIHHPPLWRLLDEWVGSLGEDVFLQTLPLLRRAFSAFSGPERQKMLALAAREESPGAAHTERGLDPDRIAIVEPVLQLLLGST